MGTRSIVAVRTGPDSFKGRYVHWDGYVEGVGVELVKILQRDGRDAAVKKLTEDRYGWSSIDADTQADQELGAGMDDGRFVVEPGYGVAYTTEQGQSSPDQWQTQEGAADSWCEYAYVIEDDGTVTPYVNDYQTKSWVVLTTDIDALMKESA